MAKQTTEERQKNLTTLRQENESLKKQLTRKNEKFVHDFHKMWHNQEDYQHRTIEEIDHDVLTQLIEGQKTGKTARQLFGTPTQFATSLIQRPKRELTLHRPNFWQACVEGGLFIGGVFTLVSGIMLIFGQIPKESQGVYGVLATILNFVLGGLALGVLQIYRPEPGSGRRGVWKYIFISILVVLGWMAVLFPALAYLPSALNPVLPPIIYVLIAILAFGGRYFFRKYYQLSE